MDLGTGTFSRETALFALVTPGPSKTVYFKRQELAPLRNRYFSEGSWSPESKQEIKNVVVLVKPMAENLQSLSIQQWILPGLFLCFARKHFALAQNSDYMICHSIIDWQMIRDRRVKISTELCFHFRMIYNNGSLKFKYNFIMGTHNEVLRKCIYSVSCIYS